MDLSICQERSEARGERGRSPFVAERREERGERREERESLRRKAEGGRRKAKRALPNRFFLHPSYFRIVPGHERRGTV